VNVVTGSSWTTDAPFRETEEAIAAARSKGILAVEKLLPFTRSRKQQKLYALRMSRTRWQWQSKILRKAKLMARSRPFAFWRASRALAET
jgi:hypothetical protein